MRHGYIPAPHSIIKRASETARWRNLSIGLGDSITLPRLTGAIPVRPRCGTSGRWRSYPIISEERYACRDEFDRLLRDAVGLRMISDVPLEHFCPAERLVSSWSGRRSRSVPVGVKTFSIGFHEATHDEAQHARAVAAHLGTDHTGTLRIPPAQARDVIPLLPAMSTSRLPILRKSRRILYRS